MDAYTTGGLDENRPLNLAGFVLFDRSVNSIDKVQKYQSNNASSMQEMIR